MISAVAAAWLAVTGVRLLTDINGSGCHGEFPFCTTPTQQSARHVFAGICGVGVLGYLIAAIPAFRSHGFSFSRVIVFLVILLALAALVADPVHHLDGLSGNEWFVGSWPLSPS